MTKETYKKLEEIHVFKVLRNLSGTLRDTSI